MAIGRVMTNNEQRMSLLLPLGWNGLWDYKAYLGKFPSPYGAIQLEACV